MDANSMVALAGLLKPPEDKEVDEELDVGPSPYATPGSIGPAVTNESGAQSKPNVASVSKDIWVPDEVFTGPQHEYDDPRPQPEYDILFKQSIGTEDVFFGMGNKNPSTASCEDFLVKIKLPGVKIKDVDLDITDTFLDCRTPKHRLGLHLPHKVDSKQSKAQWISDLEVLQITMRIQREYDFLNQ